ncbi:MAG: rRNA maturation RNase YbeY, partial [Mariprofundus sp.]|nr:rRNA maturation RNase YbeY [Mariprofundus sp.]
QWRDRDKVTDVLSFPMQETPYDFSESLGDIALAVPFIIQEADRLDLSARDHYLHLIIHATLHLLGSDHIENRDAASMQAMEREAMRRMKLHHPYPESITEENP